MQPVTAKPLRATGAQYFCWMHPGESAGLPAAINEGAFAYDYGGDGSHNRYFRVVTSAVVRPQETACIPWSLMTQKTDKSAPTLGPVPDPTSGYGCVVCQRNAVKVVFLPCKHMCACKGCSSTVSGCPICHKEVKLRIEVFQ
eukprot:m.1520642 g.1520642  ORF g.1520642 m.1520642 type:complete len:142 (-) comp25228_c0_seq12:4935-5360(-)